EDDPPRLERRTVVEEQPGAAVGSLDGIHFGPQMAQFRAGRVPLQQVPEVLAVYPSRSECSGGSVAPLARDEPVQEVRGFVRQRTHLAGGNIQQVFVELRRVGETSSQFGVGFDDGDRIAVSVAKELYRYQQAAAAASHDRNAATVCLRVGLRLEHSVYNEPADCGVPATLSTLLYRRCISKVGSTSFGS